MPRRDRSAVGNSDKRIPEQCRVVPCSPGLETISIMAQEGKDALALRSLHASHVNSSLQDQPEDVLDAQNTLSRSLSSSDGCDELFQLQKLASSDVESCSACVRTALFGDNEEHKFAQQTFSPGSHHAVTSESAGQGTFEASNSLIQTQGSPKTPNGGPSNASHARIRRGTDTAAPAASTFSSATSADSTKQLPARDPACFGPQSAGISCSPQLAYTAIVLLAASGVMGLAHCSAFITMLMDGRPLKGSALSNILLVSPLRVT